MRLVFLRDARQKNLAKDQLSEDTRSADQPAEPKVRWGRRLDRRDEAVAQFEDPVHV